MAQYILAHDLGTSGNKASLFDEKGRLIDSAVIPYAVFYPRKGWAEQDPKEWWRAVCKASKQVLERNPGISVAAVAVAGQMMGCLALDQEGEPLGNSIIWSDSRAEEECDLIVGRLTKKRYNRITGQPPSASYTLPKIVWQKKNLPHIYERATVYLQAKDYINYCLTGEIYTDPTDAAYTIAYDIQKKQWSEEVLNCAEISKERFPQIVPSETVIGYVRHTAAELTGLKEGTPVVAGAGDGSAAHLGAACVNPGDCYLCLGSSTWIVTQTSGLIFDEQGRMQSEPHVIKDQYVYLGTMQTGGFAHSWARKTLSRNPLSYEQIEELVKNSPAGANGLLFLPYLLGERSPWYDLKASGAFLGIRQGVTYGDFYRAVLEGVSMNLQILLKIMQEATEIRNIVLIGGGGKSVIWREILADIFQKNILLPENIEEGTSIGGALIAGVGIGLFEDYSCAKKFLKIKQNISPNPEYEELYKKKQDIFEQSYYALKEINKELYQM